MTNIKQQQHNIPYQAWWGLAVCGLLIGVIMGLAPYHDFEMGILWRKAVRGHTRPPDLKTDYDAHPMPMVRPPQRTGIHSRR